jgi:hypothetical protein
LARKSDSEVAGEVWCPFGSGEHGGEGGMRAGVFVVEAGDAGGGRAVTKRNTSADD